MTEPSPSEPTSAPSGASDAPRSSDAPLGAPRSSRAPRFGLFAPGRQSVPGELKKSRWERRVAKIRDEIERNRRGEPDIPTWILATALAVIVIGVTILLIYTN
jgi:hypothetical protein